MIFFRNIVIELPDYSKGIFKTIDQLKVKLSSDKAPILERLKGELEVWQDKNDVILKEASGRQGMAKHAHFWVEQLKQIGQ